MKIGFIGDLHVDYNIHHDYVDAFRRVCEDLQLDTLIFCGDTTTGVSPALHFYSQLSKSVDTKILQVPGNHELYCLPSSHKSSEIPGQICLDADETMDLLLNHTKYSLFRQPIVHGNWCIIGGPSWYDYSLHHNYVRMDRFAKQRFLRRNPEYKYIQGSQNNPFINEKIAAKSLILLEKQLRTIRERPNGKRYNICSVTHMLPIREMYKNVHIFNTTIAFMGSKYYAELYEQYGVDIGICAHSHVRKSMTKNGTNYINVSLGHNFSWTYKTNLYSEIKEVLYILDI